MQNGFQVIQRRVVRGFSIHETYCHPNITFPRQAVNASYASIVLSGSHSEVSPAGRLRHRPGLIHFHEAKEPNQASIGQEGAHCFSVAVLPERLDEFPSAFLDHSRIRLADRRALFDLLTEIYLEVGGCAPLHEELFEDRATKIFRALGKSHRREGRAPSWVETAKSILEERIVDPPSLQELAWLCCVNPTHLSAAFPKVTGKTIGSFIAELRVDRACEALIQSDEPIGRIAVSLGFCDQSHLDRHFQQIMGMTPTQFRHQDRQKNQT